jgi:hypothetical protein
VVPGIETVSISVDVDGVNSDNTTGSAHTVGIGFGSASVYDAVPPGKLRIFARGGDGKTQLAGRCR